MGDKNIYGVIFLFYFLHFVRIIILMLHYPSIPRWQESRIGEPCLAFYKYDGSNLRFEWAPKRKWYKFGARTRLFDQTDSLFGCAIQLFHDTMAKDIEDVILDHYGSKALRIVAFAEFFGPNSFAGTHVDSDPKQLVLFDVSVYKKGFIPARQFVKMFEHLPYCAKVVYDGNMNHPFINDVRNGKYDVVEGVVCKGLDWKAKVKTLSYLEKLKNTFKDDWQKYE